MKVDYHEIGERIAARRKQLGFTQEAISNLTDISVNQLSNLENSRSVPTVETVLKLSEALKVTPDYFLLGIVRSMEEKPVADIAQKALLCNDKQKRLVLDFISLLVKGKHGI